MFETIIIGAGIAGCTAAIYAARQRMNFLFLTKKFGGQFLESGEVLNYPGIIKTTGAEFSKVMKKQLAFNKVKLNEGETVNKISKNKNGFKVFTDKKQYEGRTIIIATGSHPRKLNIPSEDKFSNKGLTYCAICDGPLFKNKDVAIIGGGSSALEAVDFIKNIAKKIYVVNINKEFIAHKYLIEKAKALKNVEFMTKAKTTEIFGDKFVQGIKYEKAGKSNQLKVQGIFVEIGRIPNTDFVKNFVKLDDKQHIVIDAQTKTSVEGIFAAGDCASGQEFQYAIAAGQGCTALLKAARYLANKK